jgi:hypothetical protein
VCDDCGNGTCFECANRWYFNNSSCPTCRAVVGYVPPDTITDLTGDESVDLVATPHGYVDIWTENPDDDISIQDGYGLGPDDVSTDSAVDSDLESDSSDSEYISLQRLDAVMSPPITRSVIAAMSAPVVPMAPFVPDSAPAEPMALPVPDSKPGKNFGISLLWQYLEVSHLVMPVLGRAEYVTAGIKRRCPF